MTGLRRSEVGKQIVQARFYAGVWAKIGEERAKSMATNGVLPQREKIVFPPNTPVRLALKYAQPKIGQSPSGDEYALFTTTDNRVFFLDCEDARAITQTGVRPGQEIDITMQWSGKRGDPKIYHVSVPAPSPQPPAPRYGPQSNGTFAVPALPPDPPSTAAATNGARSPASGNGGNGYAVTQGTPQPITDPLQAPFSENGKSAKPENRKLENGNGGTPGSGPLPETKLEWELRASLEVQELKRRLAEAEKQADQEKRAEATRMAAARQETNKRQTSDNQQHTAGPMNGQGQGWREITLELGKELIGMYAEALAWGRQNHPDVRPDDVRALLTTSFIQTRRNA